MTKIFSGSLLWVAFSFTFFIIVKLVITRAYQIDAKINGDRRWRNIFTSWLNAVIVGIWSIWIFIVHPEIFQFYSMFEHSSYLTYTLSSFALGYFIYDLLEMILGKQVRNSWEVFIHHLLVIYIVSCNVALQQNVTFTAFGLAVEVNSIFLHARKLMQLSPTFSGCSRLKFINGVLNVITFILFRFGTLIVISYLMFYYCKAWSPLYTLLLWAVIILLWPINIGLLWRLLKADYLNQGEEKGKIKEVDNCNNLTNHVLQNGLTNGSLRNRK